MRSTTYDVYAVYAKPKGKRIHLRIVDEYGGQYLTGETNRVVAQPLTQGEIIEWMITTCSLDELFAHLVSSDPDDVDSALEFFWATSPFYPQFDELLKRRLRDLLETE